MNKKILIIGNVWPEPTTTAAGRRTLRMIDFYQSIQMDVIFASTSAYNDHAQHLEARNVSTQIIELNNDSFNDYITELNPDIVMYDRFMMEEQFGWRVTDCCPDALTILDTIDLHFLRTKRGEDLKGKKKRKDHEVKLREIASIYRCDISLIISKVEFELLLQMGIDERILFCLPFGVDMPNSSNWKGFDERRDFVTVGSFLHEPNVDSIKYLKEEIWPLIRKEIPTANLNIYGAYCADKHKQLSNPKAGFNVLGFAEDAIEVTENAKVVLAPLRFGAGLKGKVLEGMLTGTPSVTTPIGAEGMKKEDVEWPGIIADNAIDLAKGAIELYQNKDTWESKVNKALIHLDSEFNKNKQNEKFNLFLNQKLSNLAEERSNNLIGQILNFHGMRSTKFMSKWIEAKNKLTN